MPPTASRLTRRSVLRGLGALGLSPLASACGRDADRPLLESIDTVVVLMMENRSFDHYMGALSLVEGRTDVDGLTASMSNPHPAGGEVRVHPADASCVGDPPHSWRTSRIQFGEGRNDGFVAAHLESEGEAEAARVMGYLGRDKLSTFYTFADHFTLPTRWHSSQMAGTWPNRFYALAGENGGYRGNEFEGDYSFLNIYDRLETFGIPWATYYGNLSFSWIFPRNYPESSFRGHEQFYEDAAAGTLPNVSFVEPLYGRADDHPPTHPVAGQIFIASIYDALARSPQWDRTLFIVTYDEHGGFFDHVPPGKAPDARAAEGFDQLGFRVPSFAVGPYVRAGAASPIPFEHTSILATIERLWGIWPLTLRDEAANDLGLLLDERRLADRAPRAAPRLPQIEATEEELFAPECQYDIGFFAPRETAITGQPELERLVKARFPKLDIERHTRQGFDALLAHAEKRGLWRLRES